MSFVRDADLLRVMAISSSTKPQKNTTVELGESSMAIRLRNNSRFEGRGHQMSRRAEGYALDPAFAFV